MKNIQEKLKKQNEEQEQKPRVVIAKKLIRTRETLDKYGNIISRKVE